MPSERLRGRVPLDARRAPAPAPRPVVAGVTNLPFLVDGIAGFTSRRPEEIREWQSDLTERAGLAAKLLERWSSLKLDPEGNGSSIGGSVGVYNEVLYLIVRAAGPETVVETGISYGFSSAYVLQALHDNGHGRLYSISLPHVAEPRAAEGTESGALVYARSGAPPGAVVPDHLRYHWTIRRGNPEGILPVLLEEVGPVDLFLHDSESVMDDALREFRSAWAHLSPEGYLLTDDLHRSPALTSFLEGVGGPSFRWIGPSGRCGGVRHPAG
ncbi:MAG TPA: class I SAM-dependent methyltransferase [Thermoplasmata archaeon]|nr:class I SAM-dependent methyltransferase [Thermoplasmata archaeon]